MLKPFVKYFNIFKGTGSTKIVLQVHSLFTEGTLYIQGLPLQICWMLYHQLSIYAKPLVIYLNVFLKDKVYTHIVLKVESLFIEGTLPSAFYR